MSSTDVRWGRADRRRRSAIWAAVAGAAVCGLAFVSSAGAFTATGTVLPIASGPAAVATGDVNGDGRTDFVSVNQGSRTMTLEYNNGDGTFTAQLIGGLLLRPVSVAIGNLTGAAGGADIAVVAQGANQLQLFTRNPASPGSFNRTNLATGSSPQTVKIADLDGDGHNDLVVANGASAFLSVFTSTPAGFVSSTVPTCCDPDGAGTIDVAAGDINGDGLMDLATVSGLAGSTNTVTLYLRTAGGSYSTQTLTPGALNTDRVTLGDLGGTGPGLDIAATSNGGANVVTTFVRDPMAAGGYVVTTLDTGDPQPTTASVFSLVIGNFNGRPGIVAANRVQGTLTVWTKGPGVQSFDRQTIPSVSPNDLAVGDFNADGRPDLVTPCVFCNSVEVFTNTTNREPVAHDDAYTQISSDAALTVGVPGVLDNDTDADGDTLTAQLVSGPAHGTLSLSTDGSFAYQPPATFTGTDSFTYKANDGTADSGVATVTITVPAGGARQPQTISGTVKNAGGTGIPNICVYPFDPATGARSVDPAACTDAAGVYTIGVAVPGSYNLVFYDPSGTYATQWYDGALFEGQATPVTVVGGAATTGIDAVLAAAGGTAISGRVTTATGAGIPNVCVYPFDATTTNRTADPAACTEASGSYTLSVPAGSYNLVFYDSTGTYATQWYSGAQFEAQATPVTVVAAAATERIDATLTP